MSMFDKEIEKDKNKDIKKQILNDYSARVDSILNVIKGEFLEQISDIENEVLKDEKNTMKARNFIMVAEEKSKIEKDINVNEIFGDISFLKNNDEDNFASTLQIKFILDNNGNFKTTENGERILKTVDIGLTKDYIEENLSKLKKEKEIEFYGSEDEKRRTKIILEYEKDKSKGFVTIELTEEIKI